MLELIGNQLDNACKFAQHEVQLKFSITDQYFTPVFEDGGQGLDTMRIEKNKQRGVRLDGSTEGHGIGLSNCNDILGSYNGKIYFSQSSLGRLKVAVDIPLNTDD